MSETNPYLPPTAAVADVGTGEGMRWQPVKLFTFRGRIGRARFIAYSVWGYLIAIAAAFVLSMVTAMLAQPLLGLALGLAGLIPYAVMMGFASVQRSHDMGWNGWTTLLLLVPFVGLLWMFKGGTPGANRYGLPPPPNPLSVKIGAWLMLVMIVGGVVLAAVAVPMYNDLNASARAARERAR